MKNKIKICIASIYAFDFFSEEENRVNRVGGAEFQLFNLAYSLAQDARFEVDFFVGNFGGEKIINKYNIKVYNFFNLNKYKIIFDFIKLCFIVRKNNYDIFIQRSSGIETGLMALISKIFRVRLVYMVAHDGDVGRDAPNYLAKNFINKFRWLLYRVGLKKADLILVQNHYQKEELLKNYNKVSLIRKNAIFLDDILKEYNILEKEYVLWIGRADQRFKQPELFLELAKRIERFKFLMICQKSADLNYFENIKHRAKKISNLEFVTHVPKEEIVKYFKKSKILINTSLQEGFPNVFLEAFKFRTVVFSLNVNPDNILNDNKIGFFANGNLNELKNLVKANIENTKILSKVSENAIQYVKKNHDIKEIIKTDKELLIAIIK